MEDKLQVSYYCTEKYLDQFLGNFEIKDRPKRMLYRFLDDERETNFVPEIDFDYHLSGIKPADEILHFSPREDFNYGTLFVINRWKTSTWFQGLFASYGHI